jgi:hypothetical protein
MSDQDCCTYECEQGKNCPVRTRRVRAGHPPADIDLWVDDLPDDKDELPDWAAGLIVVVIMFVVAGCSALVVSSL